MLVSMSTSSTGTTQRTRVLIHGGSGRMGQTLLRLLPEFPALELVGAPARDSLTDAPAFDVAIDFSLPQGLAGIAALCKSRGAALVSGTTGLDDEQLELLYALAADVPVLWASNFSLGVAVLDRLVAQASPILSGAGWQCDVIEQHHIHKLDAPSGTALTLGASAERGGAEVRYVSTRAGDIVGEHTVQFAGTGERIELVHRATNRDIFARGALHCAQLLVGSAAGMKSVAEVLFDR